MPKANNVGIRAGTLAGVPVVISWSVLVLVLLVAGVLAEVTLPHAYPGYPGWSYDLAGLCIAVILLASLLAHELSHLIVARRKGVEVRRITFWILGGVSGIRGISPGPAAEAWILAVGPLVSLLVGGLFAGIAGILTLAGMDGMVDGVLAWLAVIQLAIAAINFLPVTSLDGGRILRAALWKWRGDRTKANLTVAWIGRGLGTAVIALGLVLLLGLEGISGLWIALIGWFMLAASATEEYRTNALEALVGVKVKEVMTLKPQTVPPDTSVADFLDHYIIRQGQGAFPITENGRLISFVSLERVRHVPPERRSETRLLDVACPKEQLTVTSPDEPLSNLLPRLHEGAEGLALVVSDDRLVGMVSVRDVSRAIEYRSP